MRAALSDVSQAVLTVFAPFTDTAVRAGHATLVTFAILFQAARLFAMAALGMVACVFLDLRLEGMGVAFHNGLHGLVAFMITFLVAAITAIAVWATTKT